jgi:CBS domain-containing protein
VVSSLQQLRLREHHLFLALTLAVGVLAGLSAVLFTVAIDRATRLFFGLDPSAARLFLVPVLFSFGTGALLAWIFPDVRGSGVPQTKAAFHLHRGVIPIHVPLGKFLTGVLCIGSGHSMGREGPSVQIGAGFASVVGRWAHVAPARVRNLVPVGAAGALAAAFNTPVAAVLFALEEIIGDLNASLIGSTVVASVASVERLIGVVSVESLGNAVASGHDTDAVSSLVERTIVHAHPDHPSDVVMERLAQSGGVLPVLSREDAQRVVGVVTLAHAVRFMRRCQSSAVNASPPDFRARPASPE